MEIQHIILLGILIMAVILYSTSFVSMTAVSMLILILLYVSGLTGADTLFNSFVNSSTLLVVFMFVISGALMKTGAARKIGSIMLRGAKTEKNVVMRLLFFSMFLSAFFSNMATAVIVATFAAGIAQNNKKYHLSKMVMSIGLGCILGGMLTIIGVSGNVMVKSVLEEAGVGTVGFWDFGKIGLPLCIAGALYVYLIGYKISPTVEQTVDEQEATEEGTETCGWKCIFTIIVFLAVIIGFMTESLTGIPIHITAFAGALILLLTGVISEKEAFAAIRWPSILMFASLLTLGTAISQSGIADFFADGMVSLWGQKSSSLVLTILFVIIVLLTQFMSNGATAAVFYPLGISLAARLDVSAVAVLMMINVAAGSSFATPMATPLNAYLMSIGGCKFSDYVKVGVPMMILSTVICVLLCPMIWAWQ